MRRIYIADDKEFKHPYVYDLKSKAKVENKKQAILNKKYKKTKKKYKKKKKKKFKNKEDFIRSNDFLETYEWRRIRYKALKKSNGKCQLCGRSPKDGIILNVDHINPRKTHPEFALSIGNLQVLCHDCNHGKGNADNTDWRNK